MNYGDLHDGSSNTIGLVEDANNPVPWTKPEDLTVEEVIGVLTPENSTEVSHVWSGNYGGKYGGPAVATMDGRTHIISPGYAAEVIRGWCLVDDGLAFEKPNPQASYRARRRQYYLTVALYFLLLVLPGLLTVYRRFVPAKHRRQLD